MLDEAQKEMSPMIVTVVLMLAALLGIVWIFVANQSEPAQVKPIIRENSIVLPSEGVDGYRRVTPDTNSGYQRRDVRMYRALPKNV